MVSRRDSIKKHLMKRTMLSLVFVLVAMFTMTTSVTTVHAAKKLSVSAIKKRIRKRYRKSRGQYVTKIRAKKLKFKQTGYHYRGRVYYAQGEGALMDTYYVNAKKRTAHYFSAFGDDKFIKLKS